MRNVIRDVIHDAKLRDAKHLGFCHDRTGIVRSQYSDSEYPVERDRWLGALASEPIPRDYVTFHHDVWRPALTANARHRIFELELVSRLLVGHGNPSGSEVGLTLHHTWGVPMIPGSAIKGVLAHHIAQHYGDRDDPERKAWAGVLYDEARIQAGPGDHYRTIFGAPAWREDPEGARQGKLVFHDALYVPGSTPDDKPLARDVLTVHNKKYYDDKGKQFPNDYDDPNPVAFLTVRPGARFCFVIEGEAEWLDIAESLLREALDESGVGGKTSLGYGRLRRVERATPRVQPRPQPAPSETTPQARARTSTPALDAAGKALLERFLETVKGGDAQAHLDAFARDRDALMAMHRDHRKRLRTHLTSKKGNLLRRIQPIIDELDVSLAADDDGPKSG